MINIPQAATPKALRATALLRATAGGAWGRGAVHAAQIRLDMRCRRHDTALRAVTCSHPQLWSGLVRRPRTLLARVPARLHGADEARLRGVVALAAA